MLCGTVFAVCNKLTKLLCFSVFAVAGTREPKPHLRSQHFGLPVLALGGWPRELRAQVTLDPRPLRPLLRHFFQMGLLVQLCSN